MTAPRTYSGALTRPQLDALTLAAQGFTAEQIAAKLSTTRAAVDLRINYGMHSLGARSRTHAVAVAMARGWIKANDIDGGTMTRTQEAAMLSQAATRLIDEWDALHMPRSVASSLADLLWELADHEVGPINPWAIIVAQAILGKEEDQ